GGGEPGLEFLLVLLVLRPRILRHRAAHLVGGTGLLLVQLLQFRVLLPLRGPIGRHTLLARTEVTEGAVTPVGGFPREGVEGVTPRLDTAAGERRLPGRRL